VSIFFRGCATPPDDVAQMPMPMPMPNQAAAAPAPRAFFVVALRSQEKGTRTILRYPLSDTPAGPEGERGPDVATGSEDPPAPKDSPKDSDLKGDSKESTTDLLSPIFPMLFPNTAECSCIFTLAAIGYVFITHFVNAQPLGPATASGGAGGIPEAFIFALGLQRMEDCDLWSPAIAQYKLLLQQFTVTCLRENLRCDFLGQELQGLRALRDKCDNWAEFNRQALAQSELAQEIRTLVDGINRPTADSVQVRINGFVTLEVSLPRDGAGPTSPTSPGRANDSPDTYHLRLTEPQRATLVLHPSYTLDWGTAEQFAKAFPRHSFYEAVQFFATAQTLDAYFDRAKLRSKRDGAPRGKALDHLQWLVEHRVLKVLQPHYLLLYTRAASSGLRYRPFPPLPAGGLQTQHPAVLYADPSVEALPGLQGEGFNPPARRMHFRRADTEPTSGHHGATAAAEEERPEGKGPPRQLEIPEEDWQSLLRLAKDQSRAVFEALCEHHLLDGRHSRNEIIHRHGIREATLDHILHVFEGHLLTLWY